MDTLRKIHTIDNIHDVVKDKELADNISKNRPPKPRDTASGPLFNGTLRLVKVNFNNTGNGTTLMNDTDIQTIINYLNHAINPISHYVSQYGQSNISVSSDIINFDADMGGSSTYTPDVLAGWVDSIISANNLDSSSCPIILNPPGVTNNVGDEGVLGYHQARGNVPYCFCNIQGSNLTVDDPQQAFAEVVTHEVAEMAIDPNVDHHNPEVCDACAGNCDNNWVAFFDNNDKFISALNSPPDQFNPPNGSAYYTATVVGASFQLGGRQSCLVDQSALQIACNYNPANPPAGQKRRQ